VLIALSVRCARAHAVLTDAQLAAVASNRGSGESAPAQDRTLTVDEAAAMIGVGRRFVYRNAKRLPFVKRLSAKKLICSEAGLTRWLASRKA